MKVPVIAVAATLFSAAPVAAFAQTVDQLVADHALLNAELDRCKQLGMASVDDARCKTARVAENKRFFGNGTTYTPSAPSVYPDVKIPDLKSPAEQGGPPHG